MSDDQITADIIELLFRPGEEPFFIDETAPIEEFAANTGTFLRSASHHFGITLRREHLAMTVPNLSAYIRSARA
jgi:hypothetical protein